MQSTENDTHSTGYCVHGFRCLSAQVRTNSFSLVDNTEGNRSVIGGPNSSTKCKMSGVNSAGSYATLTLKPARLSLTQVLQGTVLLTANVAFLAIPSVDSTGDVPVVHVGIANGNRTPAQVTSFLSVIFSLGCLAIGQLLLRHHMVRPQDSAEEVVSPPPPPHPWVPRDFG